MTPTRTHPLPPHPLPATPLLVGTPLQNSLEELRALLELCDTLCSPLAFTQPLPLTLPGAPLPCRHSPTEQSGGAGCVVGAA